jgi:hypothetical protein
MRYLNETDVSKVRARLRAGAQMVGKTIEEHAADTITDLKTSARDTVIRVGVIMFLCGLFLGAVLW